MLCITPLKPWAYQAYLHAACLYLAAVTLEAGITDSTHFTLQASRNGAAVGCRSLVTPVGKSQADDCNESDRGYSQRSMV